MKNAIHGLLTIVLITTFALGVTCKRTNRTNLNVQSGDGIITGQDQRQCPCCGGLMINFIGETKPYTGTFYLIDNDISAFGISDSSSFPVAVKVEYKILEKCKSTYIHINTLQRK